MTSPVRRRNPPHRAVSAPVLGDLLTRKLLATTPPSGALLLTYTSLPAWHQDNAYILSHYRPAPANSLAKCLQSLLYLHNESVNIHSHLLGCFVFLFVGIALYVLEGRGDEQVRRSDVAVFGCFFAGVVACLGMSAAYHCVGCHSERWARWANRGDYVGIVGLIWGSFVPSLWYGFGCEGEAGRRWGYLGMITILGIACTVVSVTPKFRTPQWRPFRAGMFVAMGLSAVIPVLHGLKLYGLQQMNDRIGLSWLVLQGFLYVLGAGIYAARVPERFKPGKFDIWGSSHQIFHVLILFAATSHLLGLLKAYEHSKAALAC
ncbi:MAG: hypothetical protein LQ338_000541 [Usnochroma carphineum]|nr:MAG: hypothetical protein LQ338_000541 [Usnochroma carphineum]